MTKKDIDNTLKKVRKFLLKRKYGRKVFYPKHKKLFPNEFLPLKTKI